MTVIPTTDAAADARWLISGADFGLWTFPGGFEDETENYEVTIDISPAIPAGQFTIRDIDVTEGITIDALNDGSSVAFNVEAQNTTNINVTGSGPYIASSVSAANLNSAVNFSGVDVYWSTPVDQIKITVGSEPGYTGNPGNYQIWVSDFFTCLIADPVANDDTASTHADTAIEIPVLSNDYDLGVTHYDGRTIADGGIKGITLTLPLLSSANGGTLSIVPNTADQGDDRIEYTPAAGFTGTDSFTYIISDGAGTTDTATVTVNVNEAANAITDTVATLVNTPITVTVLANDSDPDGGAIGLWDFSTTADIIGGSAQANRVSLDDNGTPDDITDDRIVYTPPNGFTGEVELTYEIMDDEEVCGHESVYENFNQYVSVATGLNSDGDDAQIVHIDQPLQTAVTTTVGLSYPADFDGDLSGVSRAFRFAPPGPTTAEQLNWQGTDVQTATITFSPPLEAGDLINVVDIDGSAASNEWMELTFLDAADAAVDTTGFGIEDEAGVRSEAFRIPPDGKIVVRNVVVGNINTPIFAVTVDQPVSKVVVAASAISDAGVQLARVGCNGSISEGKVRITVSEPAPILTKTVSPDSVVRGDAVIYTFEIENTNPTGSIVFDLIDTSMSIDARTFIADSFAITGTSGVTPTFASISNYGGNSNLNVQNINAAPGETVIATIAVDVPATMAADTYSNTARVVFSGLNIEDTVPLVVIDHIFDPIAGDDRAATHEDTPVTIPVLYNDFDPDLPAYNQIATIDRHVVITSFQTSTANGGTIGLNDNGTPSDPSDDELIYTPTVGFMGTDTFTYVIEDESGATDTATVTVEVDAAPIAVDDNAFTPLNQPVTVTLLTNDSDPDSSAVGLYLPNGALPTAAHGTVTLDDNGTPTDPTDDNLVYTPDAGYIGPDSFVYHVMDNEYVCDADAPYQADRMVWTDWDIANGAASGSGELVYIDQLSTVVTHVITATVTDPGFGSYPRVVSLATIGNNAPAGEFIYFRTSHTDDMSMRFDIEPPLDNRERIVLKDVDIRELMLIQAYDASNNPLDMDGWNVERLGNNHNLRVEKMNTNGILLTVTRGRNYRVPEFVLTPAEGQMVSRVDATAENWGLSMLTFGHATCDGCVTTATVNVVVQTAVLTKTVVPTTVVAGDVVAYSFEIDNKDLNNPVTFDFLDDSMTDGRVFVADSFVISGTSGTLPTYSSINAYAGTNTLDVDGIVAQPGEVVEIGISVLVPPTMTAGTKANTASITIGSEQITDDADLVVVPPQFPPIATDDMVSTHRDESVTVPVLYNDFDPDLPAYHLRANPDRHVQIQSFDATSANGGQIAIDDNNTPLEPGDDRLVYTPTVGFTGSDSFSYIIVDDSGQTATGTVNVFVDTPPDAQDDNATTLVNEPVPVPVLNNDGDAEDHLVGIYLENGVLPTANNGTVTLDDNGTPDDPSDDTFIYTPDPGFVGVDTFTYNVFDNAYVCEPDSDYQADELIMTDWTYTNGATNGMGMLLYTDHFTVPVTHTISATVTDPAWPGFPRVLNRSILGNTPPNTAEFLDLAIRRRDSLGIDFNFSPPLDAQERIILKDLDYTERLHIKAFGPDGTPLDVSSWKIEPQRNSVDLRVTKMGTDGIELFSSVRRNYLQPEIILTPGEDQLIADIELTADTDRSNARMQMTFAHAVCRGCLATATATINVVEPQFPPIANSDLASTHINVPVTVTVLFNDFDPDDPYNNRSNSPNDQALTIVSHHTVSPSGNGTIMQVGDQLVYTPNPGFVGTDAFNYLVQDASGQTHSAQVIVTVDQPPTAVNDSVTAVLNTPATFDVMVNDFDGDVTNIIGLSSFQTTVGSGGGTIARDDNGTPDDITDDKLIYTPAVGFLGTETFEYTIMDDERVCAPGALHADNAYYADWTYTSGSHSGTATHSYRSQPLNDVIDRVITTTVLADGNGEFRNGWPRVRNEALLFPTSQSGNVIDLITNGARSVTEEIEIVMDPPLGPHDIFVASNVNAGETMELTFYDANGLVIPPWELNQYSVESTGYRTADTNVVRDGTVMRLESLRTGDRFNNVQHAIGGFDGVARIVVSSGTHRSLRHSFSIGHLECNGCVSTATLEVEVLPPPADFSKRPLTSNPTAGSEITYEFVIKNNQGASPLFANFNDVLPANLYWVAGSLNVENEVGSFTVNNYGGTDTLSITRVEAAIGESVTITAKAFIPANQPVGPVNQSGYVNVAEQWQSGDCF